MMTKVLYVKFVQDVKPLEALLNDGWTIDLVTNCKDFAIYHLQKRK